MATRREPEEIEMTEFIEGAWAVDPDISVEDLLKLAKDTDKLEEMFKNAKEIQILIIGKTGTGKSTLINGLIGEEVADVYSGLATRGVTTEVEPYRRQISGIKVVVYDSPGLEDGSGINYLDALYEKCKNVDLVIFAIRLNDYRFVPNNPDAQALVKFTGKFEVSIWKKSIVIITCVNLAEELHPPLRLKSVKEKKSFFEDLMVDYKKAIHKILATDAHVPAEIVEKVKVVPTGHESNANLLDGTLWFSNFWLECLTSIPTVQGRASLVKVNAWRFKTSKSVTRDDFTKPLNEQPIVIQKKGLDSGSNKDIPIAVGTVVVPAVIGGLVGSVGLVAGPVGLVAIPVGVFFGMTIGALVAANKSRSKEK